VSGRPVSVRFGRFGAFAQIGTRDDADKPKFASLRPHQRMDEVTLAEALDLFQLPRTLGEWDDGHAIKVAIGRFGPYVQYGAKKYASLKPDDDPYTITLDRARDVIREKITVEANRIIQDFGEAGIQVLNGRYGPYVSDGKKNGKIPKDRDPRSLTLEECRALLAAAPERKGWGRNRAAAKTATPKAVREQAVGEGADVAAPPTNKKKKAAPKKKAAVRKRTAAKQKP
jgi:DNA topoisomerase-1